VLHYRKTFILKHQIGKPVALFGTRAIGDYCIAVSFKAVEELSIMII
jgi:hypothetical protein